jgi:hypothetical protein
VNFGIGVRVIYGHSPKPVGTREYFDEVEKRKYFVEPHIPGFAQFERWKGKKFWK